MIKQEGKGPLTLISRLKAGGPLVYSPNQPVFDFMENIKDKYDEKPSMGNLFGDPCLKRNLSQANVSSLKCSQRSFPTSAQAQERRKRGGFSTHSQLLSEVLLWSFKAPTHHCA